MNLNLLDYSNNSEVTHYLYIALQKFLIPMINKTTRAYKYNATITDHINDQSIFQFRLPYLREHEKCKNTKKDN